MRKAELIDYANQQGLNVTDDQTKAQIIEAVEALN